MSIQLYVDDEPMDAATQERIERALAQDGLRLAENEDDGPCRAWMSGVGIGPASPGERSRSFRVLVCDVSFDARKRRQGAL